MTTCALAPVSQWCHWSCSGCLRRQPAWVAPSQAHSERVTLSGIPVIHRKALRPPPSGSALLWQRCPCLALPLQAAPAGLEGSIHTRAPLNWLCPSLLSFRDQTRSGAFRPVGPETDPAAAGRPKSLALRLPFALTCRSGQRAAPLLGALKKGSAEASGAYVGFQLMLAID